MTELQQAYLDRADRALASARRAIEFGVRFNGLLQVTDPEKLMQAVRNGIGPAKAFGFGLLSLARAE